jgi:hypothetical protein
MSITQLDTELSDAELNDLVTFLAALEGEFPEITRPRLPSRPGWSVLDNEAPVAQPEAVGGQRAARAATLPGPFVGRTGRHKQVFRIDNDESSRILGSDVVLTRVSVSDRCELESESPPGRFA